MDRVFYLMSPIPEDARESTARGFSSESVFPPPENPIRQRRWPKRVFSICFAIFAFEIGLFLVIFPWMDAWNFNSIQEVVPAIRNIWGEFYVRGAVAGLGFVNLYVAGLEIARLFKRS